MDWQVPGTQHCCRILQQPLLNVQCHFKPWCLVLPVPWSLGAVPALVTHEDLLAFFRVPLHLSGPPQPPAKPSSVSFLSLL